MEFMDKFQVKHKNGIDESNEFLSKDKLIMKCSYSKDLKSQKLTENKLNVPKLLKVRQNSNSIIRKLSVSSEPGNSFIKGSKENHTCLNVRLINFRIRKIIRERKA